MDGTIKYAIGITASSALRSLRRIRSGVAALRTAAGRTIKIGITTGIAAGAISATAAVIALKRALNEAGKSEVTETGLRVMLRDAEAAKAALKSFDDFSDITPFEPGPVREAGKMLIAYQFALKDVNSLLTDAGDLAATFNAPLEDTTRILGRLKAGDFGEAFERLRDFGISRGDLQGLGLEFDKGGAFQGEADQALSAVRALIQQKYGGTMKEVSQTNVGLISTLKGKITAMLREFGQPINDAIRPLLTTAIAKTGGLVEKAKEFGRVFAHGISTAIEIVKNGQVMEVLGLGLQVAFQRAAHVLKSTFNGILQIVTTQLIPTLIAGFVSAAQVLLSPSLWQSIGGMIAGIMKGLIAQVVSANAKLFNHILPDQLGTTTDEDGRVKFRVSNKNQRAAFYAENMQAESRHDLNAASAAAGTFLKTAVPAAFETILDQAIVNAGAFKQGFKNTQLSPDLVAAEAKLREMISGASDAASFSQAKAAAEKAARENAINGEAARGGAAAAGGSGNAIARKQVDSLARVGLDISKGGASGRPRQERLLERAAKLQEQAVTALKGTLKVSFPEGAAPSAVF